MGDWKNTPTWEARRGKTQDGEWVVDMDITAGKVVLSFLQGDGSEARLTPEEADRLAMTLVKDAQYVRKRQPASG